MGTVHIFVTYHNDHLKRICQQSSSVGSS